MKNPVGWFEIYVQDMARARSFYEAVFQAKLEKLEAPGLEMWAFTMEDKSYGASGALVKMDGAPSGFAGTLVYFSSSDCAHETERIIANGGTIFRPKTSIGPYGFIALAYDPEGNMIGIHSRN